MWKKKVFNQLHVYLNHLRKLYLNDKQFLLLSAVLVGLSAGMAAVCLKTMVSLIHDLISRRLSFTTQGYLYVVLPPLGIVMTVFVVQTFFKSSFQKGTAYVHYTIAKGSSLLAFQQMYSQVFTSAITMGLGGSAGLEAPIVVTGSAIGSNYGNSYRLDYRDRTLLLSCGAAAGVAAVFNAPIAGILFAIEVLLTDITVSALIPLILSAITGALCSRFFLSEEALFRFSLQEFFSLHDIPFYLTLGLTIGVFSLYYARVYLGVEAFFLRIKRGPYIKAIIGGVALGVLCLLFPPLFGEGYDDIKVMATGDLRLFLQASLFSDWVNQPFAPVLFLGLLLFFKVIAAAMTVNAGGNGGNFAPSMFSGALIGCLFASLINATGWIKLPVSNFTLVGMAGMVSGIMYAPLTGVFLIAEISGGYDLILPLMLVSVSTFALVKYKQPFPLDKRKLAKRGHLLTHDKDKNILANLQLHKILETDFYPVPFEGRLKDLIHAISISKRNVFPVVDESQQLKGIILMEGIRDLMFKPELYEQYSIAELCQEPPACLEALSSIGHVMKKFEETGAWNLPVVQDGKYMGFVSKSSILTLYRAELVSQSKDFI